MNHAPHWTADPLELLRVDPGFRLADVDPGSSPGFEGDKAAGARALSAGLARLDDLQEQLFASSRMGGDERRILLVLQAMDTAGKGGIVKHVMGSVDPQGVQLASFKKPTEEELAHDFLWRIHKQVPGPGLIGVFDRSHYEDVLIARVRGFASPEEIERRYGAINDFERELTGTGTTVIKVMLHISPDEQRERLHDRLERPDKHWKFNPGDIDERLLWGDYQQAYQAAFDHTATADAPWYVIPANRKWYARLVVQHLLTDALERMDLDWPKADYDVEEQKARLAAS
ncbi:polyphosphate kinase 2 family protein [Agromyces sp. Leaf222]|uniref:polyphosphate kinase 2 family protein n=1 Tax=Agromyces sp. Leaf222 TaxID=1735688 RepID=UPI0006F9E7E3|nr:polyphosphate kinase 2 family protein [Agromyces sp. Leaf222]KQM82310.1 phosphate--nucleotide phosphotransferase [Agromyces sp. Leaf222]